MALESFYGGKQGVSPVIKASFEYVSKKDPAYQNRLENEYTVPTEKELMRLSAIGYEIIVNNDGTLQINSPDTLKLENINVRLKNNKTQIEWTEKLLSYFTMDECFKRVDYTDVWYGELCIIDTQNKLNPNNGKIFRRTLKRYQNPTIAGLTDTEALYAEYIGQIVGPSGGIPNFDFGSLNSEREKAIGISPTYDTESAPLDNRNWDYSYPKDTNGTLTTETPDEINDIAILSAAQPGGNTANIQMVPGKVGNNYNDTIKYTWCNVRRRLDGENNDAWIYLGFEIPYSWFDVERTEIPYWDTRSNLLVHTYNEEHPFYHNLHFYIPRGARGIGPEEIFIVGKDGKTKPDTLYDFDAIAYKKETDTYSISTDASPVDPENNEATKRPHKRDNNNQIIADQYIDKTSIYWVAKWRLYNPKMGNAEPISVYQYLGSYKEIESISVDTNRLLNGKANQDYGQMYVTYTDSSNKIKINNKLPLPKDISYNNDGTLEFTMADGATIITDGTIKELSEIKVEGNNIYAQYSTDDSTPEGKPNTPTGNPENWHLVGTLDNSGEDFNPTQVFIGEQATTKIRFSGFTPDKDSVLLPYFWSETIQEQ